MRYLVVLLALFAYTAPAVAEEDCKIGVKHKCAKALKLNPTKDPVVCIRGEVAGPAKVTFHFRRPDGTYYREPIARTYNGRWQIKFRRGTFEEVRRDGGTIKICAGEDGAIGARFEEKNVEEHLRNGPNCESEPVCLFPGLQCPSK